MGAHASRLVAPRPEVTAIDWDRRIARAAELESQYEAAAEMVRFYRTIAAFQKQVYLLAPPDLPALAMLAPELRRVIENAGRPDLAAATAHLEAFWSGESLPPEEAFVARTLLEPHAARLDRCPWCERKAQVAILRPEGHGAKRALACGLCSREYAFPRVECPACGEREFEKLPVYSATEFPHIRVDACDTCRKYVKTVDLTKNGLAVPVVDELAAVPLDLWASDHNYTKLQVNLLGL